MKFGIIVACFGLLLPCAAVAQTSSSSREAQQPAASTSTQVQSGTQTSADTQKDSEKKDDTQSAHKTHIRFGGFSVAGGYSSAPFFYGYGPFWPFGFYPYSVGFYAPFFYDGFYSPFYYGGFAYAPDKGEVKLSSAPKDAQVFLDGAYAGKADHLKDMWLDSGAYDLSVSAPGKETFHQRIYVISGKKLKIDARLMAQKDNAPMEEKR